MDIIEKIIQHKNAYENLGYPAPAFRLTCKEHKEISNRYKGENNKDYSRLKSFMGVEIVLVQEIEDYN